MRKNARVLNAFILSILLIGIIVFVIKMTILPLKYIPLDKQYSESISSEIERLEESTYMGKVEYEKE